MTKPHSDIKERDMKWINCKDKMPAKDEEVLVWVRYRNGDETFSESWLEDDGWALGSAKDFTVTHWMRVRKPNHAAQGARSASRQSPRAERPKGNNHGSTAKTTD